MYLIHDNVWGYASDRTQRFHIGTAKQVVDTALGAIAPEDAEKTLGILSSISNCSSADQ